jgi:6-phosphogluconolactonase
MRKKYNGNSYKVRDNTTYRRNVLISLNNDKLNIVQVKDLQDLSQKALEYFVNSVHQTLEQNENYYLAISGGKTPHDFYQILGTDRLSLNLPWNKIHLFWVDERFVPPDSEDSNFKLAADTFLKTVPIPEQNIHRMAGEACEYSKAVQEYDEIIRQVFKIEKGELPVFDLMILGMGADGHIGSLLPNSYALFDSDDLVTEVYQMNGGHNRMTLTHPVICNSKNLLILVSGREKAHIVREVFTEEPDEVQFPVHTLWAILDKVAWLIDEEAAAGLTAKV